MGIITQTRQLHPGMGLRQIWELTHPPMGRDAFMEIGMYAGLGQKTPQKPTRTTFSVKSNRYKNLLIGQHFTSVNQLWVCDITARAAPLLSRQTGKYLLLVFFDGCLFS